jgi:hypothetical protein
VGFREPIFGGRFDARGGWTNVTTSSSTTGNWSALRVDFGGQHRYAPPEIEDGPQLRGRTVHAMASTETGLALRPEVIHDANGYYRSLGFTFPYLRITRKQLRLAAFEHDAANDERKMHNLKQLLDPEIRAKYDLVPFWERFVDKYFQAWLKERALREAREANQHRAPWQKETTPEDLLREWGFGVQQDPEEGEEPPPELETPEVSDPDATVKIPWTYSYYVWRSDCDDTDRLGRWQELLIAEFVQVGAKRRFAVGFVGRQPHEWVAGEVRGNHVLYINEDVEPNQELAAKAVKQFLADEGKREIRG